MIKNDWSETLTTNIYIFWCMISIIIIIFASFCSSLFWVKSFKQQCKYTHQISALVFWQFFFLFSLPPHTLTCSCVISPCLPIPCGVLFPHRSGAALLPVLHWPDLTLLLVFSCIVDSYSLTSSKLSPLDRAQENMSLILLFILRWFNIFQNAWECIC